MQAGPDAVYRHRRGPELELTQGLAVIRASVSTLRVRRPARPWEHLTQNVTFGRGRKRPWTDLAAQIGRSRAVGTDQRQPLSVIESRACAHEARTWRSHGGTSTFTVSGPPRCASLHEQFIYSCVSTVHLVTSAK